MSCQWLSPLVNGRKRRTFVQMAILMLWWLQPGASAHAAIEGIAKGCLFSNVGSNGKPWKEVTPLNSSARVGDVLKERNVNPIIEYTTSQSNTLERHEFVSAAHLIGYFADGIVATNIKGIGFKVTAHPSRGNASGDLVSNTTFPSVLEKFDVEYEANIYKKIPTAYVYSLILTLPPNELPKGPLVIRSLNGVQMKLYALDLKKGAATVGQPLLELPSHNNKDRCNVWQSFTESDLLGTDEVKFSAKCQVITRKVELPLGSPSAHDFPTLGSTSSPSTVARLEVSDCTANTLPRVSFTTEPPSRCDSTGILGLTQTAQNRNSPVAQGVGIVMFNEQIPRIHCNGTQYAMERLAGNDNASFSFRAQYIRTGHITEGSANSSAQFNFTFD